MCAASSRAATWRARVVFPLPAQPTTTTRSGTGRAGTLRAVMPVTVRREAQAPQAGRQPGTQKWKRPNRQGVIAGAADGLAAPAVRERPWH